MLGFRRKRANLHEKYDQAGLGGAPVKASKASAGRPLPSTSISERPSVRPSRRQAWRSSRPHRARQTAARRRRPRSPPNRPVQRRLPHLPRRLELECAQRLPSPLMGAALLARYEDVLVRDELMDGSRLSRAEREDLLDIFFARCELTYTPPAHPTFRARLLAPAHQDLPVRGSPLG